MRAPTITAALLAVVLAACSAPAQIRDLREAEAHEHEGRNDAALEKYLAAQKSCHKVDKKRRRREACAAAHLQYAELLITMGRLREATLAYHEAEAQLARNPAAAAQACYSAALVYNDLGDTEASYKYLWRTITDYPNEGFAADAMKRLLQDGRKRAPRQLRDELQALSGSLSHTQISDNILEALAQLEEVEFQSPKTALHYYDMLVRAHPTSGFFDDALWHGARLSRGLGDGKGAAKRLRKLLSTRVVALGAGSYFSVWLDNAQLELGLVLRDDLEDYDGAIKAFTALPSDYPASLLRDDALFERAVTKARAGRTGGACKDLSKLHTKYPDSKYELQAAPKLRTELACPL